MTNPSVTPNATPPLDAAAHSIEHRDRNLALISGALLLISMPVGWLPGKTSDVIGMCVAIVIVLAVMAGLIFRLVPHERQAPANRANRSALILGIVSIIVGGAFWTGLPFAFAPAAIALGLSQRESTPEGQGRGMATAGVVLGALAAVATFVLLLIG
jgi:uncharacterized membrane protein YkvI